ncbi:MAG: hypothetical protein S4CHLAM123_04000 [Chlamydiales bacterium]|nr:hypothetical protein [Chlamydiales bacterium]
MKSLNDLYNNVYNRLFYLKESVSLVSHIGKIVYCVPSVLQATVQNYSNLSQILRGVSRVALAGCDLFAYKNVPRENLYNLRMIRRQVDIAALMAGTLDVIDGVYQLYTQSD